MFIFLKKDNTSKEFPETFKQFIKSKTNKENFFNYHLACQNKRATNSLYF